MKKTILENCPECGAKNEPYDKVNKVAKCWQCKCYYIVTERTKKLKKLIEENFKDKSIIRFIKNLFDFSKLTTLTQLRKPCPYRPNTKFIMFNDLELIGSPFLQIYQLLFLYNEEENMGFKYHTITDPRDVSHINENLIITIGDKIDLSRSRKSMSNRYDILFEIYQHCRKKKIKTIVFFPSHIKSTTIIPDFILIKDITDKFITIHNNFTELNRTFEVY